jgi:predicted negative regulator of RcsB-dependent stress response
VGAIALLLGCVFAVAGYFAYRNWRADSVQLQTTLGTQQQVISAAQQGEQAREKQLTSTLGQIAMLKQRTRTPEGVFFEEI